MDDKHINGAETESTINSGSAESQPTQFDSPQDNLVLEEKSYNKLREDFIKTLGYKDQLKVLSEASNLSQNSETFSDKALEEMFSNLNKEQLSQVEKFLPNAIKSYEHRKSLINEAMAARANSEREKELLAAYGTHGLDKVSKAQESMREYFGLDFSAFGHQSKEQYVESVHKVVNFFDSPLPKKAEPNVGISFSKEGAIKKTDKKLDLSLFN